MNIFRIKKVVEGIVLLCRQDGSVRHTHESLVEIGIQKFEHALVDERRAIADVRDSLRCFLNLVKMYDERLAKIDGHEKVYSAVHLQGIAQAEKALSNLHRFPL